MNYLYKKQALFALIVTFIMVIFIAVFIPISIKQVNDKVKENCFTDLKEVSIQLSKDLYKESDMDKNIMLAMASVICSRTDMTDSDLASVLNSYNRKNSYLTYIEILFPGNIMLNNMGERRSVDGFIDFDEEVEKGNRITDKTKSTVDENEYIIRNTVLVKNNNEVKCVLIGTVCLDDLAEKFTTNAYGGKAYVYIEDGKTGDFLLDTWHKTLGNINDMGKREMLPGYNFTDLLDNLSNNISGNTAFVSKTTNKNLYIHYEPIEINNWNVMVSVQEDIAFASYNEVSNRIYTMSIIIAVVFLIYMGLISGCLIQAYKNVYRLGNNDQTTNLQNRNAYEAYLSINQNKRFENLICIYIDANGLHEVNNKYGHVMGDHLLKTIADSLILEFDFKHIYRVGGDEFIVFIENDDFEEVNSKMKKVSEYVSSYKYSISYGIVLSKNEIGLESITKYADEEMLKNKNEYYMKNNNTR